MSRPLVQPLELAGAHAVGTGAVPGALARRLPGSSRSQATAWRSGEQLHMYCRQVSAGSLAADLKRTCRRL